MRILLTITIILILGMSCSTTKAPFTYEICVHQDADTSMVLRNEVVGVADTTVAFLSGQIFDLNTKKPLGFAIVTLTDTMTNKIYGRATDTLGQFSIVTPANSYDFGVYFVGYSSIKQDLTLGAGEIREMMIELGQGAAFVTYELKSDKKLNRRRLRKEVKELKKKR